MRANAEAAHQRDVLILSVLVAILVPILPIWGAFEFRTSDEIIFGVLLFSAFLLIDVMWLANQLVARAEREETLWTLRENCDAELLSIRAGFVRITRDAYSPRDLFVAHFEKEIHRLSEVIKEVAERRQLRVQADHFLNVDNVLDAFHGDNDRVWRFTWPLDGSGHLFDELAWKRYFEKTVSMVAKGEVAAIRAVLVLETPDVLTTPRVQKLLDFFATNAKLECCLVSSENFRTICRNNDVSARYIDFGLYGDRLLFLTEQYEPEIEGVFTKDLALIKHYRHLFDSIWNMASVAKRNPSKASQSVTLEALYEFDESDEGEAK